MKTVDRVLDHIAFAVSYIFILLLIALVFAWIPIVNIFVGACVGICILAYPFLHPTLYRDCEARQQSEADRKLIKAWETEKSLREAREFFRERG